MKRATREWLKTHRPHGRLLHDEAQDILDSDARQRAEIRDLKARLAKVAAWDGNWESWVEAQSALDLKNKDWNR